MAEPADFTKSDQIWIWMGLIFFMVHMFAFH